MKPTTIRLAAAGAALWLAVTAVQANIFVLDRREQRDGALPPYRSVGVLHHPTTRAGGTAFVIGRCHVLTAYAMEHRNQMLAASAFRAAAEHALRAEAKRALARGGNTATR